MGDQGKFGVAILAIVSGFCHGHAVSTTTCILDTIWFVDHCRSTEAIARLFCANRRFFGGDPAVEGMVFDEVSRRPDSTTTTQHQPQRLYLI